MWVEHLLGMYPHHKLRMLCTGTDTEIDQPTSFDAMLTVSNNDLTYRRQLCTLYLVKINIKTKVFYLTL